MSTFTIPLAQLAEKMQADLETVVQRSTLEVFRSVVLKTPVDTGRAKANWNVSSGTPNAATGQRLDSTPLGTANETTLALLLKTQEIPVGGVTYLTNGLPYAVRLEYGYSKQAPSGMVRLSAAEFQDHVAKAIAKNEQ